ncbi:bifunctional glutamate N-acetyltransferase/amino-acid acetyltransferase ArgJ [Luteolibacter pohnpeiensis]|uniref:Arginine biosynthesis bifunctional protein ArgJ n=1 Tax=Luteolibacter pohnpeiensis TaxID=454153 RepID=A0A934SE50_9BACT|nr:bifunctional glutamate N-acetyltransferase/amino-acid acetyltransferase ArgJ [Luteolibacter pohnpeiensis]MBK1883548.1 bifunctional glutamate N-acetyltransferase/amino-acid acetyltransferase ArgJ [Luteolibacter pohnpeiensis]
MDFPFSRIQGGVGAPKGFLTSAVSCGIKNPASDRLDLALVYSESPCASAGTFTTNRVRAAPVRVSQSNLRKGDLRAIVANSGNANACTGVQGVTDANAMCDGVAKPLGLKRSEVGVCSTGVIGLPLPMVRVTPKFEELVSKLGPKNGADVAAAIITSDTRTKEIAISFDLDGTRVRIGGCVKGAGMISPSMATMLCFITTDVNLPSACLRKTVLECVEESFNRITIDGDMSTNDSVIVLANGAAGGAPLRRNGKRCKQFREALHWVMLELAKAVVRDGERVTKFVTVKVVGAKTYLDAKKVAEAVCKSALVKSSWNGGDPNWGRIIHAVGYSRARIREELVDIHIGGKAACLGGLQAPTPMDELREVVAAPEFEIVISLNQGSADYTMYSSDLSPEYIDFNRSEYAYWKQARKDGLV